MAYRDRRTGGVMLRASQPRTGFSGRNRFDELLVEAARVATDIRSIHPQQQQHHQQQHQQSQQHQKRSNSSSGSVQFHHQASNRQVVILDLRPMANAVANIPLGGGNTKIRNIFLFFSFLFSSVHLFVYFSGYESQDAYHRSTLRFMGNKQFSNSFR